jgi:hypothetical protein
MYVSYDQALCTLCSAPEPGGGGLIALYLDAVHALSVAQPPFELVYPLPLLLLRSCTSGSASFNAAYAYLLLCWLSQG